MRQDLFGPDQSVIGVQMDREAHEIVSEGLARLASRATSRGNGDRVGNLARDIDAAGLDRESTDLFGIPFESRQAIPQEAD